MEIPQLILSNAFAFAKRYTDTQYEKKYGPSIAVMWDLIKQYHLLITTSMDERVPIIYSNNAAGYAKAIVEALPSKYSELRTVIPFELYIIRIDNVDILKLCGVTKANSNLYNILPRYTENGFTYVAPEVDLIYIYWKLYTIQNAEHWDNLLNVEQKIYEKYKSRIIHGGNNWKRNKRQDSRTIVELAMQVIKETELWKTAIFIGDTALGESSYNRVQVLDRLEVAHQVENALRMKRYEYIVKSHDIILLDSRLARKTIHIVINNNYIPFLDIYNSVEYEIIPYSVINNMKIAHPYVLMKFLFIEYWVMTMKFANKQAGANFVTAKIQHLRNMIETTHNKLDPQTVDMSSYEFIGTYVDENILAKKVSLASNLYPYFPHKGEKIVKAVERKDPHLELHRANVINAFANDFKDEIDKATQTNLSAEKEIKKIVEEYVEDYEDQL